MQYIKQTNRKETRVQFDGETFASLVAALDDLYNEKGKDKLNVAFASYVAYVDDTEANTIGFFYHDSPVVQWHRNGTITINTYGFMGQATMEKINFALRGHGHVATPWQGKSRAWMFHGKDASVTLYNGLTIDAETGVITSEAPFTTYTDLNRIVTALQRYNSKKKAPVLTTDHVAHEVYDKVLDDLIREYVEHVITVDNILWPLDGDGVECHKCNEQQEVIDRGIGEGDIKPGNFGSIKEQALAQLRAHDKRMEHLLTHVVDGEYNSSIVWIALTIGQLRPEYWMTYCDRSDNLKHVQRQVSRLLRRLLHKGIVNVA